jgi:hypothetical protein
VHKQKDQTRTTKINAVFSVIASLQGIVGAKKEGLQNDISLKSLSVQGRLITSNIIMQDLEDIGNFR